MIESISGSTDEDDDDTRRHHTNHHHQQQQEKQEKNKSTLRPLNAERHNQISDALVDQLDDELDMSARRRESVVKTDAAANTNDDANDDHDLSRTTNGTTNTTNGHHRPSSNGNATTNRRRIVTTTPTAHHRSVSAHRVAADKTSIVSTTSPASASARISAASLSRAAAYLSQGDALNSKSNRNNKSSIADTNESSTIEDLYVVLAKKENELQLAAEFGKALLERNEELSKTNERIAEEYSHKLEQLEQEKHALKRKTDTLNVEYDNRLGELQADYAILEKKYQEQQSALKRSEKEKLRTVEELAEQNKRLTGELQQATEHEELLCKQLDQLKEKLNLRLSNGHDNVVQLEALRGEIEILSKRKQDLERRLNSINSERDHLNMSLEESGDKIQMLERGINDRDARIMEMQREMDEIRQTNTWLKSSGGRSTITDQSSSSRKHNLSASQNGTDAKRRRDNAATMDSHLGPTSLFDEIEMHSSSSLSSPGANHHHHHHHHYNGRNESSDDYNIDEHNYGHNLAKSDDVNGNKSPFATINGCSSASHEVVIVEIYSMLRQFYVDLQQRKDQFTNNQQHHSSHHHHHVNGTHSPNSTADDSGISDLSAIDAKEALKLIYDAQHWTKLLANIKHLIEDMPCSTCQLMIVERHDYETLQKTHAKLNDELRHKSDQLLHLNADATQRQVELDALREQCTLLRQDLENCDMPKEEIVKLAWRTRDEAVQRKNAAEIALAKTRIENMQVSSELMEVVQQKGELSQRLAQFEDDMHLMTQDSVKAKFTWEEYAEKLRRAKQANNNVSRSNGVGASVPSIDFQQLLLNTIGSSQRLFRLSKNTNNGKKTANVSPESTKTKNDQSINGNESKVST